MCNVGEKKREFVYVCMYVSMCMRACVFILTRLMSSMP